MAQEIERKFLIDSEKWYPPNAGTPYRQGYILNQQCTLRVRQAGDHGYITLKGHRKGITRREYEYPIPLEEAQEMMHLFCGENLIEKTRYHIPFGNHVWEVDVFHGRNEGLIIAEIELPKENTPFEKPPWIKQEVSTDPRFTNQYLSQKPYSLW